MDTAHATPTTPVLRCPTTAENTRDGSRVVCHLDEGHEGDHEFSPAVHAVTVIHEYENDVLTLFETAQRHGAPDVVVALIGQAHYALHEACLYATDHYGQAGCKPAPAREQEEAAS